jgi:F-type H+-transporting ATPase subunit alpha
VFYLHSRLLERCAKLNDELGSGSMTGLPIIETKANDVSAFIPTNVISITDGQCYLEADLFNQGVRPAINVGLSVSRVGGAAQVKAMKKVSGSMKLDLAQYDDLKAFAAFASDLDAASRAQLERGARLVELLKQGQGAPVPVAKQVVSIWAGTTGRLDDVPVEDIRRFEAEFLDYISREHGDLLDSITTTGELSDENTATLEQAVDSFKQQFVTASGQPLVKDEPVEAMGEGEEDLTKIRRRTRTEADVRKVAAPDAGSGEPAARR